MFFDVSVKILIKGGPKRIKVIWVWTLGCLFESWRVLGEVKQERGEILPDSLDDSLDDSLIFVH